MLTAHLHWWSSKLISHIKSWISLYNSMSSSPELSSAGLLNRGLKACSLVAVNWGWDGGLLVDGTGLGVCLLTASCLRCCLCKESFSLCVRGSSGGRHSTSSIQERPLQRWVKKSMLSMGLGVGFLYNELSAVGRNWRSTAGLKTFLIQISIQTQPWCLG